MWMIKITIKIYQIEMDVCFFHTKPCLSLKAGFFPFVYKFLNLILTDKHGTKNLLNRVNKELYQ